MAWPSPIINASAENAGAARIVKLKFLFDTSEADKKTWCVGGEVKQKKEADVLGMLGMVSQLW